MHISVATMTMIRRSALLDMQLSGHPHKVGTFVKYNHIRSTILYYHSCATNFSVRLDPNGPFGLQICLQYKTEVAIETFWFNHL